MATDVSVPNNFVAGTPSVADDVDANFAAVVAWINANAVHLDGSKAFTAVPSGPASDPSSDNQLARKAYVDKTPDPRRGVRLQKVTQSFSAAAGTEYFSWAVETEDTDGYITTPSTTVTIPAGLGGVYVVSCVVFSLATMTLANLTNAVLDVDGAGVPLGTVGAVPSAAATYVTVLAPGATIKVGLDTTVSGTASAYLNLYRISA